MISTETKKDGDPFHAPVPSLLVFCSWVHVCCSTFLPVCRSSFGLGFDSCLSVYRGSRPLLPDHAPYHHPHAMILSSSASQFYSPPIFVTPYFSPLPRSIFTGLTPSAWRGTIPTPFRSKRIFTNLRLCLPYPPHPPVYTLPPHLPHPLLSWFLFCAAAVDVAAFAWVRESMYPSHTLSTLFLSPSDSFPFPLS